MSNNFDSSKPFHVVVVGAGASGANLSSGVIAKASQAIVETVNRPGDHMAARKLLEWHVPLSPVEAADISFDLRRQALGSRRSG